MKLDQMDQNLIIKRVDSQGFWKSFSLFYNCSFLNDCLWGKCLLGLCVCVCVSLDGHCNNPVWPQHQNCFTAKAWTQCLLFPNFILNIYSPLPFFHPPPLPVNPAIVWLPYILMDFMGLGDLSTILMINWWVHFDQWIYKSIYCCCSNRPRPQPLGYEADCGHKMRKLWQTGGKTTDLRMVWISKAG